MNNAKIWTVVKPSIGLPLYLGSVAITALLLHYALISHTTWYPAYWNGTLKKAAEVTAPAAHVASGPAYTIAK